MIFEIISAAAVGIALLLLRLSHYMQTLLPVNRLILLNPEIPQTTQCDLSM